MSPCHACFSAVCVMLRACCAALVPLCALCWHVRVYAACARCAARMPLCPVMTAHKGYVMSRTCPNYILSGRFLQAFEQRRKIITPGGLPACRVLVSCICLSVLCFAEPDVCISTCQVCASSIICIKYRMSAYWQSAYQMSTSR